MNFVFDQISTLKRRIVHSQLDSSNENNEEEKLLNGSENRPILLSMIEFILGEETYLQWLSDGNLPSQIENYTIIDQSSQFPPLIFDRFGRTDEWIIIKHKWFILMKSLFDRTMKIDFENSSFRSNNDLVCRSNQLFFLDRNFIWKTSINWIVWSILWHNGNKYRNKEKTKMVNNEWHFYWRKSLFSVWFEDTNLILYCGRRLFINPSFDFYLHIDQCRLEDLSPSYLMLTTHCCSTWSF